MNTRFLAEQIRFLSTNLLANFPNAKHPYYSSLKTLSQITVDPTLGAPWQTMTLLSDFEEQLRLLQKAFAHDLQHPAGVNNPVAQPIDLLAAISPDAKVILQDFARKQAIKLPQSSPTESLYEAIYHLSEQVFAQHRGLSSTANASFKNSDDFSNGTALTGQSGGAFTHSTWVIKKIPGKLEKPREKHQANWFAKHASDKQTAAREVIVQEFYRLLMPYQPKTRIARTTAHDVFVLSKEVAGSKPLNSLARDDLRQKLKKHKIKGMGRVLTTNLCLNEIDAKVGNMLLDGKGQIIKIDGDWGLAALRDPTSFSRKFTTQDIAALPLLDSYTPYNWLDIVQTGTANVDYALGGKTLFESGFNNDSVFRLEVNETMLQILSLPKDFLRSFVASYIVDPIEINLLTNELLANQERLRQAALPNKSFQEYLNSSKSIQKLAGTADDLYAFRTIGKKFLLPENIDVVGPLQDARLQLQADVKQLQAAAIAPVAAVTNAYNNNWLLEQLQRGLPRLPGSNGNVAQPQPAPTISANKTTLKTATTQPAKNANPADKRSSIFNTMQAQMQLFWRKKNKVAPASSSNGLFRPKK